MELVQPKPVAHGPQKTLLVFGSAFGTILLVLLAIGVRGSLDHSFDGWTIFWLSGCGAVGGWNAGGPSKKEVEKESYVEQGHLIF